MGWGFARQDWSWSDWAKVIRSSSLIRQGASIASVPGCKTWEENFVYGNSQEM